MNKYLGGFVMFTFTEAVLLVPACVHYLQRHDDDIYRDCFTLISRKILNDYLVGKRFYSHYTWTVDDWYDIPNDYFTRPLSISRYYLSKIREELMDYYCFIEYCPPHKHNFTLYPSYRLDFRSMLHNPEIIQILRTLDLPNAHDIPNISAVLHSNDSDK